MRIRGAFLWALLAFGAMAGARAEDAIWTALVLATNEHPARAEPRELAHYAGGLRTVFGYNSFYLLGDKTKKILEGSEEWMVPTRQVFLKVRCVDQAANFYAIHLELYVRRQLVVTSEVKLALHAPLYIRGPAWGQGRLIFILEVR